VEHLVHDGRGHRLDDLRLLGTERRPEVPHRALQLGPADLLGPRAELGQHRDLVADRALADVAADLLGHHHLGLGRRGGACRLVLVDDPLDVVDVVGIDAVQGVHVRVDVARDRQVHQEQRPVLPRLQHPGDLLPGDDRLWRGRGADHHVRPQEPVLHPFEGQPLTGERGCQGLGVLEGAIDHQHLRGPRGDEVLPRELGHLPGAHQQHRLPVEAVEDVARHLHRRGGHGGRGPPEVGLGPDPLRAPEGRSADAGQLAPGSAEPLGLLEGVLHLAEDLRLAEHHRIEARRHPEEMEHRRLALMRVEVGSEIGAGGAGQCRPGPVVEVGARADDVELDPVAGRDQQGFRRSLCHRLEQLGLPFLGQDQPLPDVHRGGVVREAHAHQGRAHRVTQGP
jgi:hypothetical protein